MSALIDGVAWRNTLPIQSTLANKLLTVSGADNTSNIAFAVALVDDGPGTYAIGGANLVNNAELVVSPAGALWMAQGNVGGSGSVTITSLTSTSASGTFSFTPIAVSGGATGTRNITQGVFTNIPVKSLTSGTGGMISATVDGIPWSGSRDSSAYYSNGSVTFQGTDGTGKEIAISVPLSSPGKVTLSSPASNGAIALVVAGTMNWSSALAGGRGSVTVTTLSTDRLAGTFSFFAPPGAPVTGATPNPNPTDVTDGTFDMPLTR
jgi:hypothetical protein